MTARRTGFSDDYNERRTQAFDSIRNESQFDMHGYSFDADMEGLIESLNSAVHALESQGKASTKFYRDFSKEVGEFNSFFSSPSNRERFIRTSSDTSRQMLQWRSSGIAPAGNVANKLLSRTLEKMFVGSGSVFEHSMREAYDRMRGFDRYLGRQNIWSQTVSPDRRVTGRAIGLSHHQRTASRLSHYADEDVGLPLTTERNPDVALRGSRSNPVVARTRYGKVMEQIAQQAIAEGIAEEGEGTAPRGIQAVLARVRQGVSGAGPASFIAGNAQKQALASSGIFDILHIGGRGTGTNHASAYEPDYAALAAYANRTEDPAVAAAKRRYAIQLGQVQNPGYGMPQGYGIQSFSPGESGTAPAQAARNPFSWKNIKGAITGYNLPDRASMAAVNAKGFLGKHGNQIAGAVNAVGGGVSNIFSSIAKVTDHISKGITDVFDSMGDLKTEPLKALQGVISGMSDMVTAPLELVSGVVSSIGGMLGGLGGSAGGKGSGAKGGGAAIGLAVGGTILQGIGSFMNIGIAAMKMGIGIFKSMLGTVTKISKQMLSTSPVFQAVLNILNLAYTMLFLPMATAFSDQLIPIVESVLDFSMEIGDKLSTIIGAIPKDTLNKLTDGLTDMAESFTAGVGTIGATFWDNMVDAILKMGKVISDPSFPKMVSDFLGIIPNLLDLATTIVDFISKNSEDIIKDVNAGLEVFTKMVNEGFFTKFLSFSITILDKLQSKADDIANSITILVDDLPAIMNATISLTKFFLGVANGPRTFVAALSTIPTVIANAIKGVFSGFHWPKFATGGHVPATPGGSLVTVGEGGEGEYIIPDSKMNTGITINFNGPVYGTDDFKSKVKSIVSEVTNTSYFR